VKRIIQGYRRTVVQRSPILMAVLAGWIFTGCLGGSPAVEYYTFDTMKPSADEAIADVNRQVAVSVGPVHLPSYLDRQQIATRPGGSRVRYDEFNRWAGVLDTEIPRTLAENLRILLASDRVVAYPLIASFSLDYHVGVQIERFDGTLGGDASLTARWIILSEDRGDTLAVERSDLHAKVDSSSYSDLARAHSQLLVDLSREIAAKIEEIDRLRRQHEEHEEQEEDSEPDAL
jgi:uncharacterized lipoprotein YmbA